MIEGAMSAVGKSDFPNEDGDALAGAAGVDGERTQRKVTHNHRGGVPFCADEETLLITSGRRPVGVHFMDEVRTFKGTSPPFKRTYYQFISPRKTCQWRKLYGHNEFNCFTN